MKKVIVVIVLVLAYSVYATEFEEFLNIGTSKTFNGKTITLKFFGDKEVFIKIDKSEAWFKENQPNTIEGVTILIRSISYKANKVWLNISVPFNCGDNTCSINESEGYCCKDCGCVTSSFMCIENQCVHKSLNKCVIENQTKDCDDNNTCTIDTCKGVPRTCVNEPVECKNGDGCCSSGCDNSNDNDCLPVPKCAKENETIECDDKNVCTRDYCEIECKHEVIGKCVDGDFCFKVGEIRKTQDVEKQCVESGEWIYENFVESEEKQGVIKRVFLPKISKTTKYFVIGVIIIILLSVFFAYFRRKSENLGLMQQKLDIIKEHLEK